MTDRRVVKTIKADDRIRQGVVSVVSRMPTTTDAELAELISGSEAEGEKVADEVRIPPVRAEYIEARGFLCHELLYLLGGSVEFSRASRRERVLRALESLLPVMPVCRWHPPEGCTLELVGQNARYFGTKVYRLKRGRNPEAVFFVQYRPDRGGLIPSLDKTPMLDLGFFLRPPFDHSNSNRKLEEKLRYGIYLQLFPSMCTAEAEQCIADWRLGLCRGMWKGLSEDITTDCLGNGADTDSQQFGGGVNPDCVSLTSPPSSQESQTMKAREPSPSSKGGS